LAEARDGFVIFLAQARDEFAIFFLSLNRHLYASYFICPKICFFYFFKSLVDPVLDPVTVLDPSSKIAKLYLNMT